MSLFYLIDVDFEICLERLHSAPVRIKARIFNKQCVGKSLALSYTLCMKEPQVLGSLLHITYEDAHGSNALWYAMCRKEPQAMCRKEPMVLGSFLRIMYEGPMMARRFGMLVLTKAQRQVGAVRADLVRTV